MTGVFGGRDPSGHDLSGEEGVEEQAGRIGPVHPWADAADLPDPRTRVLAQRLAVLSGGLLIGFTVTVLMAALPPRLLDPDWEARFVATIIDNVPVAAVGLGVLHLAVWVDPDDEALRRFLVLCGRAAVLAALGCLLLIPLQGLSIWGGLDRNARERSLELGKVRQELLALDQAIRAARSPEELSRSLPPQLQDVVRASGVDPSLEARKRLLQEAVSQARGRAETDFGPRRFSDLQALLPRSLRVVISSFVFAAVFLAMAEGPVGWGWFSCNKGPQRMRASNRGESVPGWPEQEYFEQLSDD